MKEPVLLSGSPTEIGYLGFYRRNPDFSLSRKMYFKVEVRDGELTASSLHGVDKCCRVSCLREKEQGLGESLSLG